MCAESNCIIGMQGERADVICLLIIKVNLNGNTKNSFSMYVALWCHSQENENEKTKHKQ